MSEAEKVELLSTVIRVVDEEEAMEFADSDKYSEMMEDFGRTAISFGQINKLGRIYNNLHERTDAFDNLDLKAGNAMWGNLEINYDNHDDYVKRVYMMKSEKEFFTKKAAEIGILKSLFELKSKQVNVYSMAASDENMVEKVTFLSTYSAIRDALLTQLILQRAEVIHYKFKLLKLAVNTKVPLSYDYYEEASVSLVSNYRNDYQLDYSIDEVDGENLLRVNGISFTTKNIDWEDNYDMMKELAGKSQLLPQSDVVKEAMMINALRLPKKVFDDEMKRK